MQRTLRLIRVALHQWPSLLAIGVLGLVASAVAALQPWPLKLLVDHALGDAGLPPALAAGLERWSVEPSPRLLVFVAAGGSLALFALNSALDVGLSWTSSHASQATAQELAAHLFDRLQRLSLRFHGRRGVGDALSRLTGDTFSAYVVTENLLVSPWQHGVRLTAVGTVAWSLDPGLAAVSFATAPVLAVTALYFGSRLKRRSRQDREAQTRLLSFVQRTLDAVPVVQAFGAERRNLARLEALGSDVVRIAQRRVFVNNGYRLVAGVTTAAGTAVVLFLGGRQVLAGALSVGSLLVFLAYLQTLQRSFHGLLGIYGRLQSVAASVERVFEVLESEDGVRSEPGAPPLPAGSGGRVRFEDVTFGYEPGRPVLEHIELDVKPGETIALVGPTGAGKSTLVSLIGRFFDPWQGRVLLDGTDVRQAQLESVRAQVALVLQEPLLLPLSVADNIAYGRPEASREQIAAAAAVANAHAFIERLPTGYATVLGERGATLSGGERQRLSIARALLKDAPVLILDEPTSALDAETEGLLLEALGRLMRGRTTFIIAHRLSTVQRADRIVVLERGRIVETGTHAELLARRGTYARLHTYQLAAVGPRRGRA